MDRAFERAEGQSFQDEVIAATPGEPRLNICLHCGVCGGSCPAGPEMDRTPSALFGMITAGLREQVLRSNTPWHCVNCYFCMVRCPQEIHIPEIMFTLKRMAIEAGSSREGSVADEPDFYQTYIFFVENYGRSYELGLAARYHLLHHPTALARMTPLGLGMLSKGRLGLIPRRIRGLKQLQAILAKARALEGVK